MKKYVMDSFAMIAFFEDEPGADRVAEILKSLMARKAKAYMSVINWGEVYCNTLREEGVETAEKVIEQLRKYPIELVDADLKLTYEAAKLKGRYKIAYADCFAAALSRKLNAVIVTGDPEFRKLGDEYSIQWLKAN
ncbi:MAG: type II toxin-antitoxin system VapC family toxin [Deltaproteobacteria bacterium]|nr:type II toxin-antitoxin system VapC family toxin [Deltaproteobacteria bacterium]MBW2026037.1 type II toxin-antitoxin system VapC family toxin [Deltaproteobacteria bacterium]